MKETMLKTQTLAIDDIYVPVKRRQTLDPKKVEVLAEISWPMVKRRQSSCELMATDLSWLKDYTAWKLVGPLARELSLPISFRPDGIRTSAGIPSAVPSAILEWLRIIGRAKQVSIAAAANLHRTTHKAAIGCANGPVLDTAYYPGTVAPASVVPPAVISRRPIVRTPIVPSFADEAVIAFRGCHCSCRERRSCCAPMS
jgi:hypothetical protein